MTFFPSRTARIAVVSCFLIASCRPDLSVCADAAQPTSGVPRCATGRVRPSPSYSASTGLRANGAPTDHLVAATVRAVDPATGLTIDPDGADAGASWLFQWSGPPLPFQVGEHVMVGRQNQWDVVQSATATAATFYLNAFTLSTPPPPVPGNGPSVSWAPACFYPVDTTCSDQSGSSHIKGVAASLGGQTAVADVGETVTVGGWQIHNVETAELAGGGGAEASATSEITALGPGAP